MSVETKAAEDPESEAYIDMSDKAAVERWCKALSVTDEALWKAVQEVGTRIDKVKDYLTAGGAADQVDG